MLSAMFTQLFSGLNIAGITEEEAEDVVIGDDLRPLCVSADQLDDQFFILGEGCFGLVTLAIQEKPLKLALEYMDMGDVLDALKRMNFSNTDLLSIICDVADGMRYISEKNYIHNDLACRNVFVNNKKEAKIGDFGLCKYVGDTGGIYEQTTHVFRNVLVAPEAMDTRKFTTKSDVWAMGILIWELYFTASGEINFWKGVILEQYEIERGKLPKPERCPREVYEYMNKLLHNNPWKRPTFTEVKNRLEEIKTSYNPCYIQ
ncbi:hypothetical protein NQ317_007908 [Molorchus minor]|uniref:Protein kinase domain-containing protein n=1 Tax=Molorchus minor TaxID=1323400 RepID=A0ABQ9JT02_9CUCU|nr:hypothetical protein NQ317_007908 [Molorchus minor]